MTALALVLVMAQVEGAAPAARPVDDVLVRLVELSRTGDGPKVSLFLEGGAQLSGEVRDLAGGTVLLVENDVLHYVRAGGVIAVTVQSPGAVQKLAIPTRTYSRVDVQKRAEELGRIVSESLGGAAFKIEIDSKLRDADLALVSAALAEAVDGILLAAEADHVRKDLARRMKRLKIGEAAKAGASFSGDALTVAISASDGATGRPSALEVRRALLAP